MGHAGKGRFSDHDPSRTLKDIQAPREAILAIAGRYGARNLRVFGSMMRGEAEIASHIDFVVELEPGRSLFGLGAW
jgi:predicted nucleotidyltransferase